MTKKTPAKAPKGLRTTLIEKALSAATETRPLDFKGDFHDDKEGWCGIIKDVVAMANNGGGILVFGCESNGKPSGKDCSHVLNIDTADLTNKVFSYTGYHLGEIEIFSVARGKDVCPVVLIGDADIPIPFTKPGEYEVTDNNGKKIKKAAFAAGVIYFRHGGKSEPGTRADLEAWIRRYVANERKAMLRNVKKIVAAPRGHVVTMMPPGAKVEIADDGVKVRYSTDPDAIKVTSLPMDKTHPYKRSELIAAVKKACGVKLGYHDVTSLNCHFKVFKQRPDMASKPHRDASPQYNDQYVQFLAQQFAADPNLLPAARDSYKAWRTKRRP